MKPLALRAACAILLLAGAPAAAAPALPLIPMPRVVHAGAQRVALSSDWQVVIESAADSVAAAQVVEALPAPVSSRRVAIARPRPRTIAFATDRALDSLPFAAQAYRLRITADRIVIAGAGAAGRYYGAQTLRQLLLAHGGTLPCLDVVDFPALEWRGISDDVSRGQIPTLATLVRRVRRLASLKINWYGLYLEPPIGTDGASALTPADLRALSLEAARHHVRLVPIVQTFGYSPALVAALESQPPRLFWPVLADEATRGSPLSPSFTRSLLGALDPLTRAVPSPWIGIGGDELGTFGLTHPDRAGIARDGSTQLRLTAFLADWLADRNRQPMVYSDYLLKFPAVLQGLDRSTVVVDWNYQPDSVYLTPRLLRQAGYRHLFVSPALWNWSAFYPRYERAFGNVGAMIDTGKAVGALGAITSGWGDNGAESLHENNDLGWALGAAASWERRSPSATEFLRRYADHAYGPGNAGMEEAERLLGFQEFTGRHAIPFRLFHARLRVHLAGPAWTERMTRLREDMARALAILDRCRPPDEAARERVALLRHAATRYRFVADRELALSRIAAELRAGGRSSSARASLARLEGELRRLSAEYQAQWLSRNARGGLEHTVARFDAQLAQLRELRRAELEGRLAVWTSTAAERERD